MNTVQWNIQPNDNFQLNVNDPIQDDVVQTIGYKLYPSDFSPVDTTTTTDASKFTYRDLGHDSINSFGK